MLLLITLRQTKEKAQQKSSFWKANFSFFSIAIRGESRSGVYLFTSVALSLWTFLRIVLPLDLYPILGMRTNRLMNAHKLSSSSSSPLVVGIKFSFYLSLYQFQLFLFSNNKSMKNSSGERKLIHHIVSGTERYALVYTERHMYLFCQSLCTWLSSFAQVHG